jgi:lysophospholipase L1-like esterase
MKVQTLRLLASLFLLNSAWLSAADTSAPAQTAPPPMRVACIGDSITLGVGVKDQKHNSYPAQLAALLGERWEVRNFGVSGTTMMKKGDRPYVERPQYRTALDYKPDIVVIALGTNDSKPQNHETNPDDFGPSYRDMIAAFRKGNPDVRIYACLPPPAFPENWGIRDSVIVQKLIPIIQKVAKDENVSVIDLHSALEDKATCFPDKVHPNEEGAKLIAETVRSGLVPANFDKLIPVK